MRSKSQPRQVRSAVSPAKASPHSRPAFTLAELTVVVAIIGLLVGILIPAIGQVHKRAKAVANAAVLSAISTGLELFKSEGNLGGDYPPSFSDADGNAPGVQIGQVDSPYTTTPTLIDQMSGAGLLVWALAGADQLGTPGFKTFRTTSVQWSEDTNGRPPSATDRKKSGAYAIDPNGQPLFPRFGPYVDLSKIQITPYEKDGGNQGFVIEAETRANNDQKIFRPYPLFLDAFGFPILYWKADPAGNRIVDKRRTDTATAGVNRGIYHWEDNWGLLDDEAGVSDYKPLKLRDYKPDDVVDELYWDPDWGPTEYGADPSTQKLPPVFTFANFIMNTKITAKLMPFKSDSYLLVTPGLDATYGTADDATNFK